MYASLRITLGKLTWEAHTPNAILITFEFDTLGDKIHHSTVRSKRQNLDEIDIACSSSAKDNYLV